MKLLKTHNVIMSSILLRDPIESRYRVSGAKSRVPGTRHLGLMFHSHVSSLSTNRRRIS